MNQTTEDLSPQTLLSIAQYTLELFHPGHPLSVTNLRDVMSEVKCFVQRRSSRLTGTPLPDDVHKALVPSSVKYTSNVIDITNCLVVGRAAAVTLGVPVNGACWVVASQCKCSAKSFPRMCSLECLPKESGKWYVLPVVCNRGVAGAFHSMNEVTFFNLVQHLAPATSDWSLEEKGFSVTVKNCNEVRWLRGDWKERLIPKLAERARVSWVRQPVEVTADLIKSCLTRFFERPRHVHVGDILKVSVKEYAPDAVFLPENLCVPFLYFIVKSLFGPGYGRLKEGSEKIGYIIMKGETMLEEGTSCQNYLPRSTFSLENIHRDLSTENFPSLLQNHCPGSMSHLRSEIVDSVRPFLLKKTPAVKPAFLLIGPTGSGKCALVSSVAAYLGLHLMSVDCSEVHGVSSGLTEGKLRALFAKASHCTPCIVMLQNIELLSKDKDEEEDVRTIEEFQERLSHISQSEFPAVLIATSTASTNLSGSLARIFVKEFKMPSLDESDRQDYLLWVLARYSVRADEDCIKQAARRTSGFLAGDLDALIVQAVRNNYRRKKKEKAWAEENVLSMLDIEEALDKMQTAYAGAIGAPKIPSVSWSDVGGLEELRDEILRTVMMPLQHPELTAAGLRRSGILLYGPPGTGKTLIAKAVATECSLNFLSVKGPELLNMYVGQSEENVRAVFERARAASPCIVFFDELDSLAPNRGRSGDSGGVMDRVVSQLLAEMDGVQKSTHVFVIGATNRPDLIDPALLRPGRFDKLLFVGACADRKSQLSVLAALTRKFRMNSDVNLENLVMHLPHQVTGADLYAACSATWMAAVRREVHSAQKGDGKKQSKVEVKQSDFLEAISNMSPSVSAEDMAYYESLSRQLSVPN